MAVRRAVDAVGGSSMEHGHPNKEGTGGDCGPLSAGCFHDVVCQLNILTTPLILGQKLGLNNECRPRFPKQPDMLFVFAITNIQRFSLQLEPRR